MNKEPIPNIDLGEPIEPVTYNNEIYWLTRKTEQYSTSDKNKPMTETIKENKLLGEKIVFNTVKPSLYRCSKCGADIQSIDGKPFYCTACEREATFTQQTKPINPDLWILPKWEYLDEKELTDIYNKNDLLTRKSVVFVEDIQYKIYNLADISSYFIEQWETVPYLAFIGLIESGKSRALDYIGATGYRMINGGSGITFPAMVRATHLYGAGILLDEAHDKINNKTETGQDLINFLKPGYRKGSKYIIADKENPERIISYNNFGFKAFAGERGFDRAMMSRCIVFEMEQDYPEVQQFSKIKNELGNLQTTLINMKYRSNTLIPPLQPDIGLTGRNLELFDSIIRTAIFLKVDYADIVEYATTRKQEEVDSFKNTDEYEVITKIKEIEQQEKLIDAPETISYKDLIERLEWEKVEGQPSPMQRLGYIFKNLQLKTKRLTSGTVLLLTDPKNERKLKYLYRRYK